MKWIKASETKSQHMVRVCCRRAGTEEGWFTGYWDHSRGVYMCVHYGPHGVKPEDIEWLDESVSLQVGEWVEFPDNWQPTKTDIKSGWKIRPSILSELVEEINNNNFVEDENATMEMMETALIFLHSKYIIIERPLPKPPITTTKTEE